MRLGDRPSRPSTRRRRRRPSIVGSKARIPSTTWPIAPASFQAGTIATSRRAAHAGAPRLEADELEQPARAMGVRVLVEHALAGATPHLLRLRGIRDELAVRRDRLLRGLDDDELGPGSNQRSMPSCGLETIAAPDDASSNGRAVDDAGTVACGRRVMLRLTRAAEIARAKTLNGMSPSSRAAPVSPWKSSPPSAKSSSGARRDGSPTIVCIQSRRNLSP